MRHMNSSGDDLAFTDEVKVYNNEGDDEDDQRKSPETLKEDKVGLVNEGEEKTPLEFDIYNKQYASSMFKVPFSTDARFANCFMSNYSSYMNGVSNHSPFIGNKMPSLMSPPVPNPFSFIPFPPLHDPFAQNVVQRNSYNQIPEYKRIAAAAAAHLYSLPSTSQHLQDVWNSAEMLAAANMNNTLPSDLSTHANSAATNTSSSTNNNESNNNNSSSSSHQQQQQSRFSSFSISSIADGNSSNTNSNHDKSNTTTSKDHNAKDHSFINDAAVSIAAAVNNSFTNASPHNSGMPLSPSMFAAAAVAAAQAVAQSNVPPHSSNSSTGLHHHQHSHPHHHAPGSNSGGSVTSPPDVSSLQKAAAAHLRFLSSLHYQKSSNTNNGFYNTNSTPNSHFAGSKSSQLNYPPAPDTAPLSVHTNNSSNSVNNPHYPTYSPATPFAQQPSSQSGFHHSSQNDCNPTNNVTGTSNDGEQRKSIYSSRSSVDQRGSVTSPESPRKPHIKKPLNAFMLFMKEMRPRVQEECTLKESAAINQILGKKWHELSREDQTKYYELARKEKELHQQMYPGWSARDNYASHSKRRKKRKLLSANSNNNSSNNNNNTNNSNSSQSNSNNCNNSNNNPRSSPINKQPLSNSSHSDGFLAAAAAVAASITGNNNSANNSNNQQTPNKYPSNKLLSDSGYGNHRTPMDLLLSQGIANNSVGNKINHTPNLNVNSNNNNNNGNNNNNSGMNGPSQASHMMSGLHNNNNNNNSNNNHHHHHHTQHSHHLQANNHHHSHHNALNMSTNASNHHLQHTGISHGSGAQFSAGHSYHTGLPAGHHPHPHSGPVQSHHHPHHGLGVGPMHHPQHTPHHAGTAGGGSNPKKCRARFGLEHQNLWCKPCRRKKKCVRFIYNTAEDSLVELVQTTSNVAAASAAALATTGVSMASMNENQFYQNHQQIKTERLINNNSNNASAMSFLQQTQQLYMQNKNLNSSDPLSMFHNLAKLQNLSANSNKNSNYSNNINNNNIDDDRILSPPVIKKPNLSTDHSFSLDNVLSNEICATKSSNTNHNIMMDLKSQLSSSCTKHSDMRPPNLFNQSTVNNINSSSSSPPPPILPSSASSSSSSSSSSSPNSSSVSLEQRISSIQTLTSNIINIDAKSNSNGNTNNTSNNNNNNNGNISYKPSSVTSISTPPTPVIENNNNSISFIKTEPITNHQTDTLTNQTKPNDNNNNQYSNDSDDKMKVQTNVNVNENDEDDDEDNMVAAGCNNNGSKTSRSPTPKLPSTSPPQTTASLFTKTVTSMTI